MLVFLYDVLQMEGDRRYSVDLCRDRRLQWNFRFVICCTTVSKNQIKLDCSNNDFVYIVFLFCIF